MPVIVAKKLILKDAEGKTTVLTEKDQIGEDVNVEFTCDGPRCKARNGEPVKYRWNQEDVKTSINALPDGFFRTIAINVDPTQQAMVVFCGKQCAKDYLTFTYVAPLSPAEKASIQMNNQAVDAKRQMKVVAFPIPPEPAPTEVPIESEVNITQ